MSRLDAIRPAARPKMHGRALISGPSGAGKTWTSLSMAHVLAEGDMSRVLMLDTERESALTYADVFPGFAHLPWRPPFDPTELADTLDRLGDSYGVVIIDSTSHFWRSQGGTLDIADGKIGGWKTARPAQERLVQSLLGVNAHLLLCVRSKMEYLIEGGKHNQTVTKLGMAPIQDDTLVYEVNIALDIDLEHRITVTKSRTPAVPVGRMYPAGLERKAAEDYAGWLAGGVPPASREQVDEIVAMFSQITDAEARKQAKDEFVECFGMPQSLTAEFATEGKAWLQERLEAIATAAEPSPLAALVEAEDDADRPRREALAEAAQSEVDPDRPIGIPDVAAKADAVFGKAAATAPRGKKQRWQKAFRHALVHALTDGTAESLNDVDPSLLPDIYGLLHDIEAGDVRFTYDLDLDAGVTFTWTDGTECTVLWSEIAAVAA